MPALTLKLALAGLAATPFTRSDVKALATAVAPLAPVLLERLGGLQEARALAEERARQARGPYRDDGGRYAAWLAKIGQE